ncbi:hypothetical protein P3S67_000483 [Capsicum chacoense]
MGLQNMSITFQGIVDGRQVQVVLQNPEYLALLVMESLNKSLANYGNNLWRTTLLIAANQNPMESLSTETLSATLNQVSQTLPFFPPQNPLLLLNGPPCFH